MKNIIVSVSDLLALAEELKADGMEYAALSLLDPDVDEGEEIPAALAVAAFKSSTPFIRTDYDDLEHIPDFD